ncbi:glycine-rich domain-containing protein [Chitinimonas sp. PSY-7]|uniref:glycine-rich domain-containing protein n=1 Tax=Chitinimonas sp. PSY-7 TaxID=3459088 RepID=UPI004040244F
MSKTFLIIGLIVISSVCLVLWRRYLALQREAYIRNFALPKGLFDKLCKLHPHLDLKECQLVSHGLRQFFLAYHKSGYKYVSMPSQVADDLWHEFILYTKNYQGFCKKAFGRFLHHTPASALNDNRQSNAGLRRCWRFVCLDENINPLSPTRLPLLFALDTKLSIANGFKYAADCQSPGSPATADAGNEIHCGGDFSSNSFDGGTDGFSDSSSSSDGGCDSGGDSGGGCGGGCGGGD